MPGAPLHFGIPDLSDNQEGWGPTTIPEQYKDVPYAPFNKGDRVGKASDWTGQSYKYQQGRYGQRDGAGITLFNYVYEDEENFHLVDSKPPPRPKYGNRRFQQNRFQQNRRDMEQRRDGGREADRERQRQQKAQQKKGQWNQYWQDRNAPRVTYNSSVDIRPEWSVLEQIPLTALTKLHFDAGEPEDITTCGAVEWYDRTYDRLTPKQEKPLSRYESRQFFKVTTTDDPIIQRLANEDAGTVFATDAILATLMCAPRSVYGWDVVVQRVGDKLFFDKRDNSFDLLTVSETAQEPIPEEKDNINAVHSLSQEATFINQNFSQQVVVKDGKKYKFQEPNPFAAQNQELASCAYRYRKWKLDDKNVLVARCEIDSIAEIKGEETLMIVKALNEFDSKITGVDWRQKLDNQRGAVLATELKNNANKLAKWTSQALLAGAGMMKLGFVSRVAPRDHYNHVILGVQGYKPKEFAAQINLNVNNMWGILKSLVEICMKLDEGKYLLVKDPNKPLIRLYEVPGDAFDDDYVEEPLAEEEQEAVEPERKDEHDEKDADADDM